MRARAIIASCVPVVLALAACGGDDDDASASGSEVEPVVAGEPFPSDRCEANKAAGLDKGWFVKPTVFTGVRNDMKIAREEIFGPVVTVIPFKDENDAVLQGNDTLYGLAAGVWTRDVKKAHRVARAIRAGTVWVNCYNVFDPVSPFGGYKQSGYGRELGRTSIDLYTQVKSVWMAM